MATVRQQLQSTDQVICQNIAMLADQRPLLSQNILAQLRNLVEGVAVLLHTGSLDAEFSYAAVDPALAFVRKNARLNFLGRFHKLLQISASHYTLDGDASERLMLKYYEYLYRIRSLLREKCALEILRNLEDFPVDLDPSLRAYHEKIAAKIEANRAKNEAIVTKDRYYIHKTRPFFVRGRIYYEVTFYPAINKVSKFDRVIGFTHLDIYDKYAAMLTLQQDWIEVLGHKMPITIIREWEVSIRPCEIENFARLLGVSTSIRTNSPEYRYLMRWITKTSRGLLELIDLPDSAYGAVRAAATARVTNAQIFPVLDKARQIVKSGAPGRNVLRYLMLRLHNQILKPLYHPEPCKQLSNLNLKYGCIPFDTMPFCTSLPDHNPSWYDLVESLDATDRAHELLARRVTNNTERLGMLYTPIADVEKYGNVKELILTYNNKLYHKHAYRQLVLDKGHVFIRGYEDDTVIIVRRLQEYASSGIAGYAEAVDRWLEMTAHGIDDPAKKNALRSLFSESRVALIYGAAGTGKSTMVNHIANFFNAKDKLFLAHTNPAVDNLRRKVTAQRSEFRTISSHIYNKSSDRQYDLLVIDECSTVSNADLVKVLEKTKFKLLVLVGDVHQIESIQFGNWFEIVRSFLPSTAVFELTKPFRTRSNALLEFWNKVRNMDDDIVEVMARYGYSTALNETLFDKRERDEIILCLNYDGLYGINNINRFLQSNNPGKEVTWRAVTYKVGDPVLFNETERFRPVIYNNLKGWIVDMQKDRGWIQFDVKLDRPISEFDVDGEELQWVGDSTVRFSVYEFNASDEDDDSLKTVVPFQVAYAVSIHKAQGLEYDSVKIVITDANEEDITHRIFYTAVTRARKHLQIFWTPETQQKVLERLREYSKSSRDVALLCSRRGLRPYNELETTSETS